MIKAIIFDMDGTLVDSEPVFSRVWDKLASSRQREYTLAMKKRVMGRPDILAELALIIEEWQIRERPEDLLQELNDLYLQMLPDTIQPMPGLYEALALLHRLRVRKAISTSSPRVWADVVVERMDIGRYMEFVVTSDDVTYGKPNPDAFLIPLERLGVRPEEAIAVEDSMAGLLSAKAAGLKTIAIKSPFYTVDELPPHDHFIESLAEIDRPLLHTLAKRIPVR
jgi:HAD superfamily hydrolase (TIGR01509 family)